MGLSSPANRRKELRGLLGAEGSLRVLTAFFLVTFRMWVVEHEEEPGDGVEGGAEEDGVAGVGRRQEEEMADILLVKSVVGI